MAGRTDAWILADAAAAHGIPADSAGLARFPRRATSRHLAPARLDTAWAARKGVMPGVRALLDALVARDDVYLALLTGNYEAGAQIKLEYFDLWRYFRCGAFGDDAPDRNRTAAEGAGARRARAAVRRVASSDAVVIGDTPLDVACAKAGGARSIAVATGSHSVEQLRAAGADVVFEDLSDTEAVLRSIFRK